MDKKELEKMVAEGANLSGADLSDADLSGANLSFANLSFANLSGVNGFILLPVQDYRGYSFPHASLVAGEWDVKAGCRDFTISEALEYWGDNYKGDRELGDMYLHAVTWLKKKVGEK